MLRITRRRKGGRDRQSGYMLLFLMLAVAMMTITLLSVAGNYRRSILRDREVEMIHRGVQYERAVRVYYKKFGNKYPTSIDQLEDMNKIRCLRRRYKDPMTPDGQWQIAHIQDLPVDYASALGGASLGTAPGGKIATTTLGTTQSGGLLGNTNSPPAADSSTPAAGSSDGSTAAGGQPSADHPSTGPADTGTSGTGTVLGGGPMYGVISKSKAEGIHSFNDKSHYNQWFFIYAPAQDKGQLLNGPFNPKLILTTVTSSTSGQPGSPAQTTQTPTTAPPTSRPVGTVAPTGTSGP